MSAVFDPRIVDPYRSPVMAEGTVSALQLIRSFPESFGLELVKEERERTGKLILRGILQKADTLNQNGRVYPKRVLEREVRNYQKFILEKRSLGECVPPGTEIMTSTGWKNIEDISDDEIILTLDRVTMSQEFQRIDEKITLKPSSPFLINLAAPSGLDYTATPDHVALLSHLDMSSGKAMTVDMTVERMVSAQVPDIESYWMLGPELQEIRLVGMVATKVPFIGNVHCVRVLNGTWLMKQGSMVCWSRNCDHPDSSVVSLKNASHIVREAYMEGDVVYGAIEVLTRLPSGQILEGLVSHDVKIGISSRGVGSTKQDGDYQVVQEDFQIVCWDAVADPSTPNAFVLPEGNLRTFSPDELQKSLREHFTRADRIDRILNDILF